MTVSAAGHSARIHVPIRTTPIASSSNIGVIATTTTVIGTMIETMTTGMMMMTTTIVAIIITGVPGLPTGITVSHGITTMVAEAP